MEDIIILGDENTDASSSKDHKSRVSDAAVMQSARSSKNNGSLAQKLNDSLARFQHLKVKDKVMFYRLMSTMLNAGMSLMKGIAVLEKQEKNPLFKKILGEMIENLRE